MITDAKNFDVSKMVFLKEKNITLPQHNTSFKRIPIKVMLNQKLWFRCSSQRKSVFRGESKKTTLKLPIVLTNKELTTDGQKTFLETIEKIIQACKQPGLHKIFYFLGPQGQRKYFLPVNASEFYAF